MLDPDEKIHAHLVSVWREAQKFLAFGGREGMLFLTDRHLCFVHKTSAKRRWWTAVASRQVLKLTRSTSPMIRYDGYDEKDLLKDLEDSRNTEISFDDILEMSFGEETWGSALDLKYVKDGKEEKHQYSIARDWVKYPAKEPTRFLRISWEPFVAFIKERQMVKE